MNELDLIIVMGVIGAITQTVKKTFIKPEYKKFTVYFAWLLGLLYVYTANHLYVFNLDHLQRCTYGTILGLASAGGHSSLKAFIKKYPKLRRLK